MDKIYRVQGMTCQNCKQKIEKKLSRRKGIWRAEVNLKTKMLYLSYDEEVISLTVIKELLADMGYELEEAEENREKQKVLLYLGVAAVFFLLLNEIMPDFSLLLTQGSKVSIIMLFIIGITTSFHCISMCGGIALSQVVADKSNFKRNLMYNAGRVISYTVLGGLVGFIGSGITLGNRVFAIVPIILGVFMIMMGLNNAGLLSLESMPFMQKINFKLAALRGKLGTDKGPFVLGLLNGLMPCGPLQLMQIYALSTGSFMAGALSMFAFSLGTVPLMLGLGLFINKLSIKSKVFVYKMGGYLILLLGISMMMNGFSTLGISTGLGGSSQNVSKGNSGIRMENGYQVIEVDVVGRRYQDIVVQKGIPVRMIMNVDPGALTSCNYAINIPEYEIFGALQEGKNLIEFNPDEAGTFMYSCWMGMIRNTITVVDGPVEDYEVPRSSEGNTFSNLGFGGGFTCH